MHVALVPMQIKRFRLRHASVANAKWLMGVLNWVGEPFGSGVARDENGRYALPWVQH